MSETNRKQLYQQFQEAFPFETLKDMPLEKYTNLNKNDSFCYWVEIRLKSLGGIQGASSFKFGIFEYNKVPSSDPKQYIHDDKYAWQSRFGNNPQEAYANVLGMICDVATAARKGDFEAVEQIELSTLFKWKIAFLYSNESLIPIYNKDMLVDIADAMGMEEPKQKSISEIQRFLIQQKGETDLYDYCNELFALSKGKQIEGGKVADVRYWTYSPGEGARKWELCQKDGIMCIGWEEIGDLNGYKSLKETKEALKKALDADKSYRNSGLAVWEFSHVMKPGDIVYAKLGSKIIVGRGVVTSDYMFDKHYDEYNNVRKVNWTHVGSWNAPHDSALKTLTDITKYPEYVKALEAMFDNKETKEKQYWWLVANPKIWSMQSMALGGTIDYSLYSESGKQRRVFQNFIDAKKGDIVIGYESTPKKKIVALAEVYQENDGKHLRFKKTESLLSPIEYSAIKDLPELANMQFFGNPQGSFFRLTKDEFDTLMDLIREYNPLQLTKDFTAYDKSQFLKEVFMNPEDYDKLVKLLQSKNNIILQGAPGVGKTFSAKRLAFSIMGKKDESRIEFVQFHQNYCYEDFVMGYKPQEEGGFKLKTGVFYNFCKKAASDPDNEYFFIIDEINRGNLSKIFGELLMLIEKDYRNTDIKLAYSDEPFSVPSNIFIIGMMNTADRSLAMIDYALRRRFSFFDMEPGFLSNGFKDYQKKLGNDKFDSVIEYIVALNETIKDDGSLGAGFCIGHSYFCNQEKIDEAWLRNVVEFDIIPMLREYWFDNDKKFKEESEKLKSLVQ